MWKRRLINALADALFPHKCLVCGRFFKPINIHCNISAFSQPTGNKELFKALLDPFFCAECINNYSELTKPYCRKCGVMFKSRMGENRICSACLTEPRKFASAIAPGIYAGTLKKAIHQLKYNGAVQLHKPLGFFLYRFFRSGFNDAMPDVVLPVPLYPSKMMKRGFNQSYLLIKNWPLYEKSENTADLLYEIAQDVLIKIKPTPTQAGTSKTIRGESVKGAFAVAGPDRIRNKRILLVDDVLTTGSTADECSKELIKAGASEVHVLTLARTLEY